MNIDEVVKKVTDEVYKQIGTCANAAQPAACAAELAGHIEHSILNPDMTREKIIAECALAKQYKFANVCVTPYFVREAAQALKACNVGVCAPVGFPQGAASTAAKICEIKECVANGATELDVELNIVAIKSGEFDEVKRELKAMVDAAGFGAKVKAIFEQGLLTDDEKKKTLEIIRDVAPAYVKISNALTGKAACKNDVAFVKGIVGDAVKIKIDGGIKTAAFAREILDSGAERIGCSASVAIVTGA
jgi:deoxyribose-phosphate aldolase